MDDKIQIINSAEAVEATVRSEIDIAVNTAKQYPRDLEKCRDEILKLATSSKETAESFFYHLPRGGKTIEGASVRAAEIIEYSLGNINSGFRIVGNDGKKITAQAVAHDLERNNRVMIEISRRIIDKQGRTYDQDMQIVTGNAAGAVAWRNAIFKLLPNAVWIDIQEKIKTFIAGAEKKTDKAFQDRLKAVMKKFADLGADEKKVCEVLKVNSTKDIDRDELIRLYGVLTAINEGSTTVQEIFNITGQTSEEDFSDDSPEEEITEPENTDQEETGKDGKLNLK
jgi:hypothetical protein